MEERGKHMRTKSGTAGFGQGNARLKANRPETLARSILAKEADMKNFDCLVKLNDLRE
jgi:hypothetical protein